MHVARFEPAAPRHRDPVLHILQMPDLVRIGRNGEAHAFPFGGAQQRAVQIEPLGAGVDLQPDAASAALRRPPRNRTGRVALQQDAPVGCPRMRRWGIRARAAAGRSSPPLPDSCGCARCRSRGRVRPARRRRGPSRRLRRMSHSMPEKSRSGNPLRLISRTRCAKATTRASSRPFAMASAFE